MFLIKEFCVPNVQSIFLNLKIFLIFSNAVSSLTAVLKPIPITPEILSTSSPIRERKSTIFNELIPIFF